MKNEIVEHKIFGKGTIKDVRDYGNGKKYITVEFQSCTKNFIYPEAFEKFLLAKNEVVQKNAEEAIEKNKLEAEAKLEKEKALAAEKSKKMAEMLSKQKNYAKVSVGTFLINSNLVKGRTYGTNAKQTFLSCAEAFGWDKSEAKNFGWHTLNYSHIATVEGYSVWFLAHNNWTGTYTYNVKNKISETYMEQWWMESDHPVATTRKRLIFAKKDNHYIFLGLFKFIGKERTEIQDGKVYYIEKFDLVSEEYPE